VENGVAALLRSLATTTAAVARRGDRVDFLNERGDTGYSPTSSFDHRRSDHRFEQVMAYF